MEGGGQRWCKVVSWLPALMNERVGEREFSGFRERESETERMKMKQRDED